MSEEEKKNEDFPVSEETGLDATPQKRKRGNDSGEQILPNRENFVTLARRVKQPLRLLVLIERICLIQIPQELQDFAKTAKAALTPPQRRKLYEWVVTLSPDQLTRIEKCSDRIQSLRDEFGIQAVISQLDKKNPEDAAALSEPSDRFTRSLYLFMRQEYPEVGAADDRRFELAEWRQSINHQWSNQDYASHFLGPKEAQPQSEVEVTDQLRERIAELFEGVNPQDILVQYFHNYDRSHTSRYEEDSVQNDAPRKLQHTITATFNGTKVYFKQVNNAEVIEMEPHATLDLVFSWEPDSGMLGVFCKDKSLRGQLAAVFQKTVLGSDAAIAGLPMCSFDLKEFSTSAILNKIAGSLEVGVNSISIQKIRLTNLTREVNVAIMRPGDARRQIASHLEISRDRRDDRDIYKVAADAYKLNSLNADDISRVNLSLSIARQTHHKAHSIAVQITMPNGLSSRCKTADDRHLMRQQLIKLGIMTEVQMA
jgi:hypothetical protein